MKNLFLFRLLFTVSAFVGLLWLHDYVASNNSSDNEFLGTVSTLMIGCILYSLYLVATYLIDSDTSTRKIIEKK